MHDARLPQEPLEVQHRVQATALLFPSFETFHQRLVKLARTRPRVALQLAQDLRRYGCAGTRVFIVDFLERKLFHESINSNRTRAAGRGSRPGATTARARRAGLPVPCAPAQASPEATAAPQAFPELKNSFSATEARRRAAAPRRRSRCRAETTAAGRASPAARGARRAAPRCCRGRVAARASRAAACPRPWRAPRAAPESADRRSR